MARFGIFDVTPKPEILLALKPAFRDRGGIDLVTVDRNGATNWYVLNIGEDGCVHFYRPFPEGVGFVLDGSEEVAVGDSYD